MHWVGHVWVSSAFLAGSEPHQPLCEVWESCSQAA